MTDGVAEADGDKASPAAPELAEVRHLLAAGELLPAAAVLDRLAAENERKGNVRHQAASLQMAATVYRLAGDLPTARARAGDAERLAPDGREGVAAARERGEIASALGEWDEASQAFADAIARAETAGWAAGRLAALVRLHAEALGRDGRTEAGLAELARATELSSVEGARPELAARLAQATALIGAGQLSEADVEVDSALVLATAAGDHAALSDVAILQVSLALKRGEPEVAVAAAERARSEALEGPAPLNYLAASVTLAELHATQGRLDAAYETLAVTLVTLGDVLGIDQARALVEPKLVELRDRWGAERFEVVKRDYEERRRRIIRPGGRSPT